MGTISHNVTSFTYNTSQVSSAQYFFIYPGIYNSGSLAHTLSLRMSGAKVWQKLSDNSYLIAFGSLTSNSNIAGASYPYLLDHLDTSLLTWSDYYTRHRIT